MIQLCWKRYCHNSKLTIHLQVVEQFNNLWKTYLCGGQWGIIIKILKTHTHTETKTKNLPPLCLFLQDASASFYPQMHLWEHRGMHLVTQTFNITCWNVLGGRGDGHGKSCLPQLLLSYPSWHWRTNGSLPPKTRFLKQIPLEMEPFKTALTIAGHPRD